MGCASGKGAGPRNIFGNKYGQNLAAVQIARERRMEAKRLREEQQAREEEERENEHQQQHQQLAADGGDSDGGEETDDDTTDEEDEDWGPSPAAGIWAGSQKLQAETEKIAEGEDANDATVNDGNDEKEPAAKRAKT